MASTKNSLYPPVFSIVDLPDPIDLLLIDATKGLSFETPGRMDICLKPGAIITKRIHSPVLL